MRLVILVGDVYWWQHEFVLVSSVWAYHLLTLKQSIAGLTSPRTTRGMEASKYVGV